MDSVKMNYDYIIHSYNRIIGMLKQYINETNNIKQLSKTDMKETIDDILSECQYAARISLYFAESNLEHQTHLMELHQTIFNLSNQALSISIEKLQS